MVPRHARLQNMTYSSRMKLNVQLHVSKEYYLHRNFKFMIFSFFFVSVSTDKCPFVWM